MRKSAVWLSRQDGIRPAGLTIVAALLLLGLLFPFLTAWRLTLGDPVLRDDLCRRLLRPGRQQLRLATLFWASIVFAVYWTVWHAPLGMVAHYYQAQVVESGWVHTLNFALSLIPFVLIMNWLYFRSNRSIPVAIVFHLSAGLFNELFQTPPDTKVIQTGLLFTLTVAIIIADPSFFFGKTIVACPPRGGSA